MKNWADLFRDFFALVIPYIVMFFAPIVGMLLLIAVLTLADYYTGVKAAVKREERIQENGFRRTWAKLLLYILAVLITQGVQLHAHGLFAFLPEAMQKNMNLTAGAATIIIVKEYASNMRNISTATGVDFRKIVGNLLKSLTKKK